MRSNVPSVGQKAPDFNALTSEGKFFQLWEAVKSSSNNMLVFYRGNW
ncbi:MAG: hypothetical protein SVZ03_06860 [Spirochaetota bacterium]|nr:hypothetical protein [Spirochaetota bacterium]